MERFDKYLAALWKDYGLYGVIAVILLAAGLIWWAGIDVASIVNRWLGL